MPVHQPGLMQVRTSLQTDNHASTPPLSFLQAGCPSCRPTNSVKALMTTLRCVLTACRNVDNNDRGGEREPAAVHPAVDRGITVLLADDTGATAAWHLRHDDGHRTQAEHHRTIFPHERVARRVQHRHQHWSVIRFFALLT